MQIAIDTSTDTASLALVQEDEVLAELTWRCAQNHTIQLLPHLHHLLEQTGLSLRSAGCIIVAKGPGSYNGLRVGISTAKGLAFSLGIPVIGVSTLETEAYQHAYTGLPVCPVLDARRGEIATATYQMKRNKWRQLAAESLTTIDDLCSRTTTKTIFCGEYVPAISAGLKQRLGKKAVILSPAAGLRRAGFLAELGLKRFKEGSYDSAATLQPIYLRGPSITKQKHR